MTEPTETPGQQAPAPVQQANQTVDWEARYKGASTTINTLTNEIATLKQQLSTAASEMEQLRTNLGVKDVEKNTAVGSYQQQLQAALTENESLKREVGELRQLKAKLDIAKKLNAPQLTTILDQIPYVENADALEAVARTFLDWADNQVKARVEQLAIGTTPASPSAVSTAPVLPANSTDWQKYVFGKPVGPEREAAYEQWFKWGQSQQR